MSTVYASISFPGNFSYFDVLRKYASLNQRVFGHETHPKIHLVCRDRDLTEREGELIKKLATSEPVVKNLWLLWELYMNSNKTNNENMANFTDWKTFLSQNREFIESFDFLKDLAIENPGES